MANKTSILRLSREQPQEMKQLKFIYLAL